MPLPDQAIADLDPQWFLEEENIRVQDEIVVDLILKSCGETFDALQPFQQTIYLDDIPIRTLTLDGLLKTKNGSGIAQRIPAYHEGFALLYYLGVFGSLREPKRNCQQGCDLNSESLRSSLTLCRQKDAHHYCSV